MEVEELCPVCSCKQTADKQKQTQGAPVETRPSCGAPACVEASATVCSSMTRKYKMVQGRRSGPVTCDACQPQAGAGRCDGRRRRTLAPSQCALLAFRRPLCSISPGLRSTWVPPAGAVAVPVTFALRLRSFSMIGERLAVRERLSVPKKRSARLPAAMSTNPSALQCCGTAQRAPAAAFAPPLAPHGCGHLNWQHRCLKSASRSSKSTLPSSRPS